MGDSLLGTILESSAYEWVRIVTFVFGGCCSNVWALESILKQHPQSGTFLTFSQFVYVALGTLPSQIQLFWPPESGKGLRFPRARLKKRKVPLSRWIIQTAFFLLVSLMNNYAFGLKIPMVVHIIFRSGGLCVSMLVGYLFGGKRYSLGQVLSGIIITVGIVLATLSAPRRVRSSETASTTTTTTSNLRRHNEWLSDSAQYFAGVALLSTALFLGAWLGLWQEETYRRYGKQWREGLFYCHTLSLPFFAPMAPSIVSTFSAYTQSPPVALYAFAPSADPLSLQSSSSWTKRFSAFPLVVPSAFVALAVNVLTQAICIRGVNRLTARVTSTTVNLVLTVRKAASLAISVWYYGSGITPGLVIGGLMVLGGTIMYSFAPTPEPDKPAETVITPPIKPVPRLGETPSPASFKNHKQLPLHRRHGRKESNSDL